MTCQLLRHTAGTPARSSRLACKKHRLTLETLEDRIALSSDSVLDWNAVMLEANAVDHGLAPPDQGGPTRTARAFAIVHAAIYDAVNGIERTHQPYLVHTRAPRGANLDAAVVGAAYTTLAALFPQQRATFTAAMVDALADIPNGLGEVKGFAYGSFVGVAMLASRLGDGSRAAMPYTPGTELGDHNVDPLHPGQGFLDPLWGKVKPFTLTKGSQFRADPPPALDSAAYAEAYNEVYVVGAVDAETADRDENLLPDRTPEQTEIGIYWGYDGSPGLGTPPRLYNQIAVAVAQQAGNTEVENARLLALVNLAQADAGISCWDTKYFHNFWRPILGVRAGELDGNPDTIGEADWEPLGAPRSNDPGLNKNFTPPFPAYTSGHSTFGAATFQTLANFYGSDSIPGGPLTFISDEFNGVTVDQDGSIRPISPRTFDTFGEMSEENGQSRMYLGIHWAFDKTQGIAKGNLIADWAFDNYLQPLSSARTASATRPAALPSLDHIVGLLAATGEKLNTPLAPRGSLPSETASAAPKSLAVALQPAGQATGANAEEVIQLQSLLAARPKSVFLANMENWFETR